MYRAASQGKEVHPNSQDWLKLVVEDPPNAMNLETTPVLWEESF